MPEVPSVGTVDYQNQIQNIPEEPQQLPVDMSPMQNNMGEVPIVYDPETEEKRKSAGSMTGLTLLGTLALLAVGVLGGRKLGQKGAKDAVKELEELKNSDAVKYYDKVKEECEKMQNAVNEILETAEKTSDFKLYKPKTWKNANFVKIIKEKLSPFKKDTEKIADEVKDSAEKAADEAKEAADDAAGSK